MNVLTTKPLSPLRDIITKCITRVVGNTPVSEFVFSGPSLGNDQEGIQAMHYLVHYVAEYESHIVLNFFRIN